MPTTIEIKLYKYDELPNEKAKEKARDWWKRASEQDNFWDGTYEDFKEVAARMGFDVGTRTENWYCTDGRSGTRQRDCIYFSGFWSQGDGACFEGTWQPHPPLENSDKKTFPSFREAIQAYAPKDDTLLNIATDLDKARDWVAKHNAASRDPKGECRFCQVTAKITQRGHYYHSGCMDFEFRDNEWEDANGNWHNLPDWFEPLVVKAARQLADWLYKRLEEAHDDYFSDEQVEENIRANDYDFEEDGTRSRHA